MNYRNASIGIPTCLALALLAACSTGKAPSAKDAQIPPAVNYDVKIQPARIAPNPQGAFALSTFTGCDVIYVGKAAEVDTITYAVRPTSRVPDAERCAALLREQPGVETVTALR